jgi:glycosyltransferase involved in cell wall biosynthesis
VSVVIPCHNYAHYLREAIDSALAQGYSPIEVLVIDDGSEDETAAVACSYGPRVAYEFTPGLGLPAVRNAGAERCNGEFVVFLDADDWLEPRYVETCITPFNGGPQVGFVYTQVRHFGSVELVTKHPPYDLATLKIGNYVHAAALIRTELVRRFKYDRSLPAWEDWSFYLTLAEHGYRGVLVDEPLLHYRRNDATMTAGLGQLDRQRLRWEVYRRHRRLYAVRFLLSYRLRLAKAVAAMRYRDFRGRRVGHT